MIRHISLYKLRDAQKKEEMKQLLAAAGASSSLVVCTKVYSSMDSGNERPPFIADIVQILDFINEEDARAWPQSKEHVELVKHTAALTLLAAIDYAE